MSDSGPRIPQYSSRNPTGAWAMSWEMGEISDGQSQTEVLCAELRGFWVGHFSKSSIRPSSCNIASVEGCIVSPRRSRRTSSCFSSTRTSMSARASNSPCIIPAGLLPATQEFSSIVRRAHHVSSMGFRSDRTIRYAEARFSGLLPGRDQESL